MATVSAATVSRVINQQDGYSKMPKRKFYRILNIILEIDRAGGVVENLFTNTLKYNGVCYHW